MEFLIQVVVSQLPGAVAGLHSTHPNSILLLQLTLRIPTLSYTRQYIR